MKVNPINSQIALNDLWNEGWEDKSPKRKSTIKLVDDKIELNDWWGEGWSDGKRPR